MSAPNVDRALTAACSVPAILAALAEGDGHGFAILQRLRDRSAGRAEWTDGMLYPLLHQLERLGYVAARWEAAGGGRRRRVYRIIRGERAPPPHEPP